MKRVLIYIMTALSGVFLLTSCGPNRYLLELESRQESESEWKTELYSLYYYDSDAWYTAIEKADALDWKGAVDVWMGLVQTNNQLKRACASYNIATACYMLGDYDLALSWLNQVSKDTDVIVTDGLRQKIKAKQ